VTAVTVSGAREPYHRRIMTSIPVRQGRLTAPACATAGAGLLIALTACGADLLLPGEPGASGRSLALQIERGAGQHGTVGEPLAEPLGVRVVDEQGRPVPGTPVAFTPLGERAGSVEPDTAYTDAEGRASARWVLGTVAGPLEMRAHVALPRGPSALLFAAEAEPAAPATIGRVSGNGQSGLPGRLLAEPLVVRLLDRYGNPVPEVDVSWRVDGGGYVSAPVARTGSEGIATVDWVLGEAPEQRAVAVVDGVFGSPLAFTAATD
jgi:hypothetical protein